MPIHLPALSRREFLAGSLAAGGYWLSRGLVQAADDPAATSHWALFSDTHIPPSSDVAFRGVNMSAHLEQAIRAVLDEPVRPAGVLVDGDCAFLAGQAADYAHLVGLLKPLRQAGLPVHLALGNHDHRERFWEALPPDAQAVQPVADRHVSIVPAGWANFFVLDSLDVTNQTPGLLGEAQLVWLAAALDLHHDKPAIVLGHHHPARVSQISGLKDTAALFDVLLPRRHVKAYIFGHTHHWAVRAEEGLHLVNLPPTAYPFNDRDPSGWVGLVLGADGAMLRLHAIDPSHPADGQEVQLDWRAG